MIIFLLFSVVESAVVITYSDPEVKKTGESVRIWCKTSGFTFGDYSMLWYQQLPGKGPRWIAFITYWAGSNIQYIPSVQGRFVISRDNPNSLLYLQMNNLRVEDTAIYYCER
uniref:Ig-like domain-containing protein n=1 Tax=Latimeria chalumnae TaxID=7897 RepID=H3AHM0_LATCH